MTGPRTSPEPDVVPATSMPESISFRRRSFLGNAFILLTSQGVTWMFAFVVAIVQPRYLGPAATGQLRLGLSLWAMAEVFIAFGTPTLLTLRFARGHEGNTDLLGGALVLQCGMYFIASLGVMAFALLAGYERRAVTVIALVGISSLFNCIAGVGRGALMGLERMEFIAVADVVGKLVLSAAVVVVLVMGADVRSVAVVIVVGSALNAALLLMALKRLGLRTRFRSGLTRELMRESRSFLLVDATLVLYQQLDVVIISLLIGATSVGWYSSANALFGSLMFVPSILMSSLFPVLVRLSVERPDALLMSMRRAFTGLIVIAAPVGLGTMLLADRIAVLLFGSDFAGAGPVLAVMGLALVATFPSILFGRYALAIGKQRFWAALMIVATVATVPLDLVFVSWTDRAFDNGAIGGSMSFLVTETFLVVVGAWRLMPQLFDRSTVLRLAKTAVAATAMCAAVWPLRAAFIAVPIVAGAVTYCAAVAAFHVLTTEDVTQLRSLRTRALRPIEYRRGRLTSAVAGKENHA